MNRENVSSKALHSLLVRCHNWYLCAAEEMIHPYPMCRRNLYEAIGLHHNVISFAVHSGARAEDSSVDVMRCGSCLTAVEPREGGRRGPEVAEKLPIDLVTNLPG
jgi:hypothetical protein